MPRIILPKELAHNWLLETDRGLPVLENGALCLLAVASIEAKQSHLSNWRWGVPTHVLAYFERSAHPWVVWGFTYDGCHHGSYFLDYQSALECLWHRAEEARSSSFGQSPAPEITPEARREAMKQRVIYTRTLSTSWSDTRRGRIGTVVEYDGSAPLRPGMTVVWDDDSTQEQVRSGSLSPARAHSYSLWVEDKPTGQETWGANGASWEDVERNTFLNVELADGVELTYVLEEDHGWCLEDVNGETLRFRSDPMSCDDLEELHGFPPGLEYDAGNASPHDSVTRVFIDNRTTRPAEVSND